MYTNPEICLIICWQLLVEDDVLIRRRLTGASGLFDDVSDPMRADQSRFMRLWYRMK